MARVNLSEASVSVNGTTVSTIGRGLLLLLGVGPSDTNDDIEWLAGKISNMRIFADADGKMNLSVCDISSDLLVVSQFTLYASTKKGNRPSFLESAAPGIAEPLYCNFCDAIEKKIGRPAASALVQPAGRSLLLARSNIAAPSAVHLPFFFCILKNS